MIKLHAIYSRISANLPVKPALKSNDGAWKRSASGKALISDVCFEEVHVAGCRYQRVFMATVCGQSRRLFTTSIAISFIGVEQIFCGQRGGTRRFGSKSLARMRLSVHTARSSYVMKINDILTK